MKKALQVIVFLLIMIALIYLSKQYLQSQLIGSISIVITLSGIFIGILIFLENRQPAKTITWLIVLAIFPLIGFIFYVTFGRDYRKKKMFKQKALLDEEQFSRFQSSRPINEDEIEKMGGHQQALFRLAHKLGKSPISFSSETEVLTNGTETFTQIIKELENAREHIHLEYYIVRSDDIGNKIKDVLVSKAKQGVEIRFLYDAVGSWKLSKEYIADLKSAGVQMVPFMPVKLPFLNHNINFRNHRKIIVVDGNIGFVGGLNIGDEYLGKNPYFGHWRDTHLYVIGESVRSLQLIFLQDWYYMTGETLLTPSYLSPVFKEEKRAGGVQMIAGGPDNEWDIIKNLFFSMIISAKKSIWITSPYFIPDDDILSALNIAALSGIDVRLIMPNRPDKKIVFYASRSYYPDLLEAGVKVYEYTKGFLHNKIIIVDDELASIGTSNMDMRSFHLNFEVNAFLYKTESTLRLVNDYKQDIEDSNQITIEEFKDRPLLSKIIESTSRLLSPLL